MTNPLSHRAVLVTLSQRAWKGRTTDRELAAQTELNASAEQGTMTVIKELTPKYLIQPIRTILRIGREEHYKMSSPGLLRGQHLLPAKMFETYMLSQGAIKDEFFQVVEKYVDVYPDVRKAASKRLGTGFKERDFPTTSEIKSYFGYSFYASPVPEVGDWRVDGVDPKELSEMKKEVEASVSSMFNEAVTTLYDRAREMLEKLVNQAKNFSTDAPGAMLRDATIDQVKELSAMICDMNVTGDPLLDKLGKEMLKEFAELSGTELRRNADARKNAATTAQRLLSKMVSQKRRAA
jgi:hypothetical protein